MAAFFRLAYNKWFPPPLPAPNTFKDHTVLVTGATGGLGLETAIHYVNLGASRVIITARTLTRGLGAKAAIEARTGKTGIVEVRELNMDTLAGVKSFADALRDEVKAVDVVLLNAGVYKRAHVSSPDGWEETLQVNTLSTILLALLLLAWMRDAPSASGKRQHLGFVSSGLHTKPRIDAEDFPKEDVIKYWSEEKHFVVQGSYAISKLFMMYGVEEIAKLAKGEDGSPSPIVNSMCPGLCKSDLGRQYTAGSILASILLSIFWALFAKSTEASARTMVLAAMTGPEEHGKFIRHYGRDEKYQEWAVNNFTNEEGKKLQAQLWKEMLDIFEAVVPEASKIALPKL